MQGQLWAVSCFVVHISHKYSVCLYEKKLRSWTHAYECERKMQQNYLDGLAYAVVFPRAKHVGADVLKMLFSTSDMSFRFGLEVTQNLLYLAENIYSTLRGLTLQKLVKFAILFLLQNKGLYRLIGKIPKYYGASATRKPINTGLNVGITRTFIIFSDVF